MNVPHERLELLKTDLLAVLRSHSTFDIQAFWTMLRDDERIALEAMHELRHHLEDLRTHLAEHRHHKPGS